MYILENILKNNLYSSPSIVREIKSRKIRWAELVACVGKMRNTKFTQENLWEEVMWETYM